MEKSSHILAWRNKININLSCMLLSCIQKKKNKIKKKKIKKPCKFVNKRIERCLLLFENKKSPGADKINFDIIKRCFGRLCCLFRYLFNSSLRGVPGPNEGRYSITCLCPTSVVPLFSKILERVKYSRLYKYLTEKKYCIHNILVSKKVTVQNIHLLSL